MARMRTAPSARAAQQNAQTKRQALKEKTNTSRTKASEEEESGAKKDFVKDATTRSTRPRKTTQADDELVMAGGLGKASDPPVSEMTTDELAKSDAPPPATAKANRRPPRMARKVVQSQAQSKLMDDLKKRMAATARKEAGKTADAPETIESTAESSDPLPSIAPRTRRSPATAAVETSDLSLSLSLSSPPAPQQQSSMIGRRTSLMPPGSALKSLGTPAVESSFLALKNFKRRPRQHSMLQMVQQKTGGGRPSIAQTDANYESEVFDLGSDSGEDEDEFAPEAEGTPLQANKPRTRVSLSTRKAQQTEAVDENISTSPVASKKRKSQDLDNSSSALGALMAKRRKSGAEQDSNATPSDVQRRTRTRRTPSVRHSSPEEPSDVVVAHSQQTSTPLTEHDSHIDEMIVPSTEREREYEDAELNETMADPASSSPAPVDRRAEEEQAYILADPVTQVSPRPTRRKAQPPPKELSTKTLQSLLPRRRQPQRQRPRKGEYELSDSEEETPEVSYFDDDEDELSGMRRPAKAAPKRAKKAPLAKSRQAATRNQKSNAKKSASALTPRKSAASTNKPPTKTYGKQKPAADSDRENYVVESGEDEEDSTTLPEVSMYEAVQSRELEEAKRKFADVDDWDMEFENMSQEDHRSSSQLWR